MRPWKIPKPSFENELAPCKGGCKCVACVFMKRLSKRKCRFCDKKLGYNTLIFVEDDDIVSHWHCIEEYFLRTTQMSEEKQEKPLGAFIESLKRNNKQIRDDRATAIAEDTELLFKRTIEDLEMKIKRMERERDNMLDLSPSDARSLVLASDFDADAFVSKDVDLGVKIRNEKIKLEIARDRFNLLFGGE